MQLMAYFGSVICIRYALLDESFDRDEIQKYAIAGSNNEIINLLKQKGFSFDDCFEVSVKFHRYDVSDWLSRNYKCETFELSHTVEYFNIRAFYFLLKNKISSSDYSLKKSLLSSAKNGIFFVVRYLCDKGVNVNAIVDYVTTPLHLAGENGHLDVVRYLCEEKGANVNVTYEH